MKPARNEVIRARVPRQMKRRVLQLAAKQHSDEAQIVRSAVVEFLERHDIPASEKAEVAA